MAVHHPPQWILMAVIPFCMLHNQTCIRASNCLKLHLSGHIAKARSMRVMTEAMIQTGSNLSIIKLGCHTIIVEQLVNRCGQTSITFIEIQKLIKVGAIPWQMLSVNVKRLFERHHHLLTRMRKMLRVKRTWWQIARLHISLPSLMLNLRFVNPRIVLLIIFNPVREDLYLTDLLVKNSSPETRDIVALKGGTLAWYCATIYRTCCQTLQVHQKVQRAATKWIFLRTEHRR